jgi:hypothetical protein
LCNLPDVCWARTGGCLSPGPLVVGAYQHRRLAFTSRSRTSRNLSVSILGGLGGLGGESEPEGEISEVL